MTSTLTRPASAGASVTSFGTALARYALATILGLIGLSKFTAGEATGIMPLVAHSPLLGWTYSLGSTQSVSDVIGAVELLTAILLLARPISARVAAAGGVLAVLTFLTTLSFLFSTPGAFAFSGLAVLGDIGGFLIKDLGLLAAALVVLGESLGAWDKNDAMHADARDVARAAS